MSMSPTFMLACAVLPAGLVATLVLRHQSGKVRLNDRNSSAIQATLERVVPAHNDAFFVYVLENRTNSDYRVTSSDVQILGRSRSMGDLIPKVRDHVSGEFPLFVPAQRKVHFALVWTAEHDIDPGRMDEFIRTLNLKSFVLVDNAGRYQVDFPVSR